MKYKFFNKNSVLYFFLSVIIFSSVLFVSCGQSAYFFAKENVSEQRLVTFEGRNEKVYVTLTSGYREKDYILNGVHTENIEYAVLTIKFLETSFIAPETANFYLTIDDINFSGKLERNPFNNTLQADLKKLIVDSKTILFNCDIFENFTLVNLNNISYLWAINADNALEIACKNLESTIKNNFIENGNFMGEVYVKMINSEENIDSPYVWYVTFLNNDNKSFGVIISPESGKVLATRN